MRFSLQWSNHLVDVVDGGIVQGAVVVPQGVPHRWKWFSNHVQDPPEKNYKGISEFLIIEMVQQSFTYRILLTTNYIDSGWQGISEFLIIEMVQQSCAGSSCEKI